VVRLSVERLEFPSDPFQFRRIHDRGVPQQVGSAGRAPARSECRRIVVSGSSTTIVEALGTALAAQPGLEVLCTVTTEAEMFDVICRRRPDGVVFYVPRLDADTIRTIDRLKEQGPAMRVVMLTGQLSVQALAEAAEAGAAACLSLNAHVRDLAEAVRADTTDTMLVDPTSLSAPAQARQVEVAGQVVTDLTRRELEVLSLLANGFSPPAIAADLVISIYTARGHVKSVLRKLGAHSQLEAVAMARKLRLVGPGSPATGSHKH
jgi:DNA-binding NarL/FixJ family response regulator